MTKLKTTAPSLKDGLTEHKPKQQPLYCHKLYTTQHTGILKLKTPKS